MRSIFTSPLKLTLGVFIIVLLITLIEHFTSGVITHHFLADDNLPGISNWWGLITVPLLAWITARLVLRRDNKKVQSQQRINNFQDQVVIRFMVGLVFGITAALLWEFNLANILEYFILLPLVIALFIPIHFAECLLGFVLGMLYTFGGILPIIVGLVLLTLSALINLTIKLMKRAIVG